MPLIPFHQMPDSARVWIFGASRPMSDDEELTFLSRVDGFLDSWAAHGTPLTVARDWRDGRFLQVAVDEASVPPSGCSIDAMVNTLKDLERELGVVLVDNGPVWYRDDGSVGRVSRAEFKALVDDGTVTPATLVFDNSVTRVGQIRAGQWERAVSDAWHGKAFFKTARPSA